MRRLAQGRRIAYTISRPEESPDGAPLAVLHGWGGGRADWVAASEALAADARTRRRVVVAIDMPGHGDSVVGDGDLTIGGYVDDVAGILREEGLSGVAAVGHSLGGVIAVELAVRHPDLVSRIVGVDTFHYLQVYPKQDEHEVHAFADGFTSDLESSVANLVELSSTPTTDEETRAHVRRTTLAAARQPAVVDLLVDGLRWDLDAALEELAQRPAPVPVSAIVAGPLVSAEARARYAGRISFTDFPDRGHYFPMEDPAGTARAIANELS